MHTLPDENRVSTLSERSSASAPLQSQADTLAPDTANSRAYKDMMGRTSVFRGAAQTVATNVVQVATVLANASLTARILGPGGKGAYDLFVTTAQIAQTIIGFSLPSGITYTVASRTLNLTRLSRFILAFAVLQGFLAAIVLFLLRSTHSSKLFIPPNLPAASPLVAAAVTALALSACYRSVLAGDRRFGAANIGDILKQFLAFVTILIAFFVGRSFHFNLLLLFVMANIATVAITASFYRKLGRIVPTDASASGGIKECLRFSLPCYFGNLVQFVNYRIDVFFVNSIAGPDKLGIYFVSVLLCQSINLVPSAAQAVLFPAIASNNRGNADLELIARANRMLTALGVLGAFAVAFLSRFAVPLFFGKAFSESILPLFILLPGCVVFITTNILAGYLNGVGKPQLNLISSVLAMSVQVPLELLLIPKLSISGAAAAATCSYFVNALVTLVLYHRTTRAQISKLYILQRDDWPYFKASINRLLLLGRALKLGT